jgi:hypothetical protein
VPYFQRKRRGAKALNCALAIVQEGMSFPTRIILVNPDIPYMVSLDFHLARERQLQHEPAVTSQPTGWLAYGGVSRTKTTKKERGHVTNTTKAVYIVGNNPINECKSPGILYGFGCLKNPSKIPNLFT